MDFDEYLLPRAMVRDGMCVHQFGLSLPGDAGTYLAQRLE